jgi:hypothetical protein
MSEQVVVTLGSTPIIEGEDPAIPDAAVWHRALEDAQAKARTLAIAAHHELGALVKVEEIDTSTKGTERLLIVRVTHDWSMQSGVGAEQPLGAKLEDDILKYVEEELRPIYGAFRTQLLASEPRLSAAAAPLRNGRRRYEGFRLRSRRIIYAGFQRKGVRLMFELPDDHGLPLGEFARRGRRDWREVLLTSMHQLEGALLLARDTVRAFDE